MQQEPERVHSLPCWWASGNTGSHALQKFDGTQRLLERAAGSIACLESERSDLMCLSIRFPFVDEDSRRPALMASLEWMLEKNRPFQAGPEWISPSRVAP